MPFYKCGNNKSAVMSSRITGLISMYFFLFLSFFITVFCTRYLETKNVSREKQLSKKAIYEKNYAHVLTKSPQVIQIINLNDKRRLSEVNDLSIMQPKLNFVNNRSDMKNVTNSLVQNFATNNLNTTLLPRNSITSMKEFKMPNTIRSTNISVLNSNQLDLMDLNNRAIFKQGSNPFFYRTRTKAHNLKQIHLPLPLRNKNRETKPNKEIQINFQASSITPVYMEYNNNTYDDSKKYLDLHQALYKNGKSLSSKINYDMSSDSPDLSLSLQLRENETNNESTILEEKGTSAVLAHDLQHFPSTLGYIFRTILQNKRANDTKISRNQTERIIQSENIDNIHNNMKTPLLEYLTKIERAQKSGDDYDMLKNSAVKFILNGQIPDKKSSASITEMPFSIHALSDTLFFNRNESGLDLSENINTYRRKNSNLNSTSNDHRRDTAKETLPTLSTVSRFLNAPRFSQTFIGEDNTLDNVFEENYKTTENQLLKPIYHTYNESHLNTMHDFQILAITEPTNGDFSSRKSKMSNSDKSHKMNTTFSEDFIDLKLGDRINDLPVPEFQPGTLVHFSEIFHRRPVYEAKKFPSSSSSPQSYQDEYIHFTKNRATTPKENTFEKSSDELNAIGSTYFPFRMEDVSMQFADKGASITKTSISRSTDAHTQRTNVKISDNNKDDQDEDDDYRDMKETSLTMETLAYFLIGTCCGLSILCLCIVVAAIKCRRSFVERKVRKQFRSKLFYPHRYPKLSAATWQQQFLDQFMYHRDNKKPNSSCSSRDTCNCKCVTWSLGVRNLDTQPIYPTQNSVYLCGRKRLPFGAASTLQYESMLGRRQMSPPRRLPPSPPKPESSNENDSLDEDSATEPVENTCPKQCTCIGPAVWKLHEGPSIYSACPVIRPNPIPEHIGNNRDRRREMRYMTGDFPPPVSGLNYLDRAEGVVYWTSNEERLI